MFWWPGLLAHPSAQHHYQSFEYFPIVAFMTLVVTVTVFVFSFEMAQGLAIIGRNAIVSQYTVCLVLLRLYDDLIALLESDFELSNMTTKQLQTKAAQGLIEFINKSPSPWHGLYDVITIIVAVCLCGSQNMLEIKQCEPLRDVNMLCVQGLDIVQVLYTSKTIVLYM